jgi:hypothetical protein
LVAELRLRATERRTPAVSSPSDHKPHSRSAKVERVAGSTQAESPGFVPRLLRVLPTLHHSDNPKAPNINTAINATITAPGCSG